VKDGTVTFSVNGKVVYTAKASDVDVAGIVGYRVNHNLDVHLSAIGIHKGLGGQRGLRREAHR